MSKFSMKPAGIRRKIVGIGRRFFIRSAFFFIIAVIPLTSLEANAQTCNYWVGKAVSVQGDAETLRAGETQWRPVKFKDTFCPGDMLRVLERSRADIVLINETIVRLDQNTTIIFSKPRQETTFLLDLLNGIAHFFSRFRRSLTVATPFVNASVEGTEFLVKVGDNKTVVTVFEGHVTAANNSGSIPLTAGQSAEAEAGKAPVMQLLVRPHDAVQWMLYYPPVFYYYPAVYESAPSAEWQEKVRKSMEFYRKGDLRNAFAAVAGDVRDQRFFNYRASLLLSVGRIEEAKADVEKAFSLAPTDGQAYALQSIIALTQNEKEKAIILAESAVKNAPDSATPRIALSYALQANFDLEGAMSSLVDAVQAEPGNVLALARLAEVQLMFGEIDKAFDVAKRAVALDPDIARPHTVVGFVYLASTETKLSKEEFERAIELDQADPLPRLGLGLAKIREGDLVGGREEIGIAVSLDPENSLLRSYLGKAYYEEKRDDQASRQFEEAKEFDPLDPTPFFYDAVRKQSVNRPVEALHDMQRSIELNDNRAVYRSRLLLDEDLASRSAAIGRIYSDLGFQQLALVEGWKSVNTDPANYSAHRFLADSYSALPNHEIARVSELLQSQLLQPINITPIQPHLSESNLFVISGGGPAAVSFNEFNPLFNRNGYSLQVNGIVGENSTFGEEIVASGIYNKGSFSVGQYHYETDGWRRNANQDDNIVNAFLQYELSPETSVQAEYRYRDNKTGDLQLRFFPENVNFGQTITERKNTFRLGARHAFSPSSVVLVSFIYTNVDYTNKDDQPVALPGIINLIDAERPEEAYSGEFQYLWSSRYVNIAAGAGYTTIRGETTIDTGFVDPPVIFEIPPISTDLRHNNWYAYSYIKPLNNLTLTVGASLDSTDGSSPEIAGKEQFNPKFGITWNPVTNTTVRAAVFRTLKRTLTTDQTLEPTQVAGFNQFYDDANGTEAWRYGAAIDQKFSKNLFGGVECSQRALKVALVDTESGEAPQFDWDESLVRAYLFWTPHPWVGLRAEYQYEKIDRDPGLTDGVRKLETNRVPLGISFYHPSGLSASVTTTYYKQQGEFDHLNLFEGSESGEDDFWLVDAAIKYRLPKRYGFITVGATNLFDKNFNYYDLDWKNPSIQPGRFFFGKVELALP